MFHKAGMKMMFVAWHCWWKIRDNEE